MERTSHRLAVLVARWLWLAVAVGVLLAAGYLLSSINRLQDSAALSARVAELRTFQEELVGTSLLWAVAGGSGELETQLVSLQSQTAAHIEVLRPELSGAIGAEATEKRLRSIEEGFATMLSAPSGITDEGLIGPEVALTYAATSASLNSTIDSILVDLGDRGTAAVAEVQTAAVVGVALLVFGGMAAAGGFGWTTRRAARLSGDMRRTQLLDRQKSEFVAVASHELRTPLTGIHGFASLLAQEDDVSEEQRREWAGHIYAESERLTQIVNDLLNLSRIESGRFVVEAEPVLLPSTLGNIAATFDAASDGHAVVLSPGAKALAANVFVIADEPKLREVMANLVDNAIKYSPAGGNVEIAWGVVGEAVRVDVSDQGVGIDEDDQARIFERFERIELAETRNVRSTGLGLYLVKEMVTRMGGEVSVRSEVGRGSTFSFTLPLAKSPDQEVAA